MQAKQLGEVLLDDNYPPDKKYTTCTLYEAPFVPGIITEFFEGWEIKGCKLYCNFKAPGVYEYSFQYKPVFYIDFLEIVEMKDGCQIETKTLNGVSISQIENCWFDSFIFHPNLKVNTIGDFVNIFTLLELPLHLKENML